MKLLVSFIVIFISQFLWASDVQIGNEYYVGASSLSVRNKPSANGKRINRLFINDKVKVLSKSNSQFARVKILKSYEKFGRGPHYVLSSHLKKKRSYYGLEKRDYEYQVEILISDIHPPGRKWGHVSLRILGPDYDEVFDFGRYGKMFGIFDAEGEPVIRTWIKRFPQYMRYHLGKGGRVARVIKKSTAKRNEDVRDFFWDIINPRKVYRNVGRNSTHRHASNLVFGKKNFHAFYHNCTTLSIEGFHKAFPEVKLNEKYYIQAVDMPLHVLMAARAYKWDHHFWPMDVLLMAVDFVHEEKVFSKVELWHDSTSLNPYKVIN